jgi:hypothetical protein
MNRLTTDDRCRVLACLVEGNGSRIRVYYLVDGSAYEAECAALLAKVLET